MHPDLSLRLNLDINLDQQHHKKIIDTSVAFYNARKEKIYWFRARFEFRFKIRFEAKFEPRFQG